MAAFHGFAVTRWISASPGRAFAGFLALHVAVWTALPALLYPNLPLDLIEALIYGREWQLGYDKLPPLPWWLVEIAYRLIGHDFAYYLLAEIAVVAAFAFVLGAGATVARRARRFGCRADYRRAALLQLHRRQIQSRCHTVAVLGDGRLCLPPRFARRRDPALAAARSCRRHIAMGEVFRRGSGWVPLALFVLLDRDARKALATPGPYIAILVALAVMAPHLVWLGATTSCPSPMPSTARCCRAAGTTTSGIRCNSPSASSSS